MSLEWEQVVVASSDPAALGRWWSEALRWVIVNDDPVVFEIQPQPDRLPGILFLAADERHTMEPDCHQASTKSQWCVSQAHP